MYETPASFSVMMKIFINRDDDFAAGKQDLPDMWRQPFHEGSNESSDANIRPIGKPFSLGSL